MIKTLQELKVITNDLTNFSHINLTDINPILVGCFPQEQKNRWFIQNSISVHGNIYNYSNTTYTNKRTKVTIMCPIHGVFEQNPYSHMTGQGCKSCGLIKNGNSFRKSPEKFIEEANKVHNNKYNYSLTKYVNNKTKVIIICPEHGDFEQPPYSHLKYGCPKCGIIKNSISFRKPIKQFTEEAIKIHNGKYDYSKVNYLCGSDKIEIVCSTHGSFFQAPVNHLKGHGCPDCADTRKTTEQFITEAKVIHGDKYDYSKVSYVNANVKVNIVCSRHGSFWQRPSSHINDKYGCPKCGSSKGENQIYQILQQNGIEFKTQYNFNKHPELRNKFAYMTFDFYLPNFNLCIEYDGEQHFHLFETKTFKYDLNKIQHRDSLKNLFCLKNNILLVRIPYWVKVSTNMILQIIEQKSTITSVIK